MLCRRRRDFLEPSREGFLPPEGYCIRAEPEAGIFWRVCLHERLTSSTTMSLATTVPRKQAARPAKPAARYWKGKAPQGITDAQSDSDEDDEEQRDDMEEGDVALDEEMNMDDEEEDEGMTLRNQEVAKTKAMNIALKDVAVKDGKVIVSGRDEVGRTALEQRESGFLVISVTLADQLSEAKADDEESEEESEDEESEEEEVSLI